MTPSDEAAPIETPRRWTGPFSLPYTLWVLLLALLVSGFSTLDRTIVSILIDEIRISGFVPVLGSQAV